MRRVGPCWIGRLWRWTPVLAISVEHARFDMQAIEKPQISGVAYQPGTPAGYEIRGYILEKFGRACAYCGVCNVPLQIEHMISRARAGSNRVSNLTMACVPCNTDKGAGPVEFLAGKRTKLTAHGFPRGYCMRTESVPGSKTGDRVRAEVPKGRKAAIHVGRVAVCASGSFQMGNADAINARSYKRLHRADGYRYACRPALPPPAEAGGLMRRSADGICHPCSAILSL
jgi:hypothetical protein